MKIVAIGILLLLLTGGLNAEIVALPDVSKPIYIVADEYQLYVGQSEDGLIYSIKDFILKRKLGSRGEGPGEFKNTPAVNAQTNRLLIKSSGKLSIFSKEGEFINEIKTAEFIYGIMKPLDGLYVGLNYSFNQNATSEKNINFGYTLYFYDSKLQRVKKAFDMAINSNGLHFFGETFRFKTNGKHLFLFRGKELNIEVFDKKLNKLYSITRDYEPVKLTEERKAVLLKALDTPPKGRERLYRISKSGAS